MRFLKIIFFLFKMTGIALLIIAGLVVIYLLSAYGLSRICVDKEPVEGNDISIYILTNGVHTDLVLPVHTAYIDWSKNIKYNNTVGKDSAVQFVAMGWGDKGFYLETPTWADLKFSTAFNAAFSRSTAAIHASFYRSLKEGNDCKKIRLTTEQYMRLVQYILNSLSKDDNGNAIYIKTNANYGLNDAFYEANGSYSLFHTCNTWANNGLKSCGQKASLWTPFDTGIFYHY